MHNCLIVCSSFIKIEKIKPFNDLRLIILAIFLSPACTVDWCVKRMKNQLNRWQQSVSVQVLETPMLQHTLFQWMDLYQASVLAWLESWPIHLNRVKQENLQTMLGRRPPKKQTGKHWLKTKLVFFIENKASAIVPQWIFFISVLHKINVHVFLFHDSRTAWHHSSVTRS